MSKDLLRRCEAHKAQNKETENTKGTGFHNQDTDPTNRSRLLAPQHNGLPALSEHLIFYHCDEDIRFVGPDATAAMGALQKWFNFNKDRKPFEMTGTEQKLVYSYIPKLRLQDVDGVATLVINRGWWNDILHVLYLERLGVCGAPLEHDGTTP